jgi:hypothetical protein
VTKVPVVTLQKPTTYRHNNMSSIGAALAMDIDMSLLPTDRAQETAPQRHGNNDDVTVARNNLSAPTPVDNKPNSLVLKLEFRSQTKETPSVYASQAKTIIMEIIAKFPNEVTVFDIQEKEIKRIDSAFSNDKFNRVFNRPRRSNIAIFTSSASPPRPHFLRSARHPASNNSSRPMVPSCKQRPGKPTLRTLPFLDGRWD